jgi:hypothetical protein
MRRFLLFGFLAALSCEIFAEDPDLIFSGNFHQTPFFQFAEQVERENNVRFFFRPEWMGEIRINATGDSLLLSKVLEESFHGTSLRFLISKHLQVFITRNNPLVSKLPLEIAVAEEISPGEPLYDRSEYLQVEKTYLEGRTTGMAETIIIGNEKQNVTGERVVISGQINDSQTNEPLIGATIYIEELKLGIVSDIHGQYSLVLPPGKYSAMINCMGMKEIRYFLEVYSNDRLNIVMDSRIIPINEVTVTADQYHNVRGMQMGYERLNIKSIKEIPVVMGEKDVIRIIQMMPGIQSVGEGAAGLNVRGSAADQNIFYINKLPVYNPTHLFGFFSSFNPDIIKDFSFYKSNMPASFGGRLASVFDIATIQGNQKNFTARGGISPVTGHLAVEGPIVRDKASYVLSGRSTYSDWILKQIKDPAIRNSNAFFYDLSANVNVEPNEKDLVRAFFYSSHDRFRLAETNEYSYANQGGSVGWRHRISPAISADFSAVVSKYGFSTVEEGFPLVAYSHTYEILHNELKADLSWFAGQKHRLTFGAGAIFYHLDRGDVLPYGEDSKRDPVTLGKERGVETAIYLADEIRLHPKLTLYGGIRISGFVLFGPGTVQLYHPDAPRDTANVTGNIEYGKGEIIQSYLGPEPRIALNYLTGTNSSFKVSYNRIRQYLFMLSNTIAISPVDQWKLVDFHLKPPTADQVSAGFYKDFPEPGLNSSVELYYKKTRNLVEFKDAAHFLSSPNIETEVLQGDQSAWGIEFMLRKNTGKLNGWISYALSRSIVTVDGGHPWEQINAGEPYPSNYDKPHSLNLVTNYRTTRRVSFSANLVYSTGRPFTAPKDIYYISGQSIVNYSKRNEYRLPDYFRIDFSMNIEGNLKARKLAHSYWMLSVYNLTGRKNAYSVFFASEEGKIQAYKMSIFGTPVVTISWNFKLGNYATE